MNSRRMLLLLACAVLLTAGLACQVISATTPSVSNIRMTTDETGKTATTSYAPGDQFYVFADLSNLEAGSKIGATWYAVNTEGQDPNTVLNTSDYDYQAGIGNLYFKLSTSDGGDWPIGTYRVELTLNGTKVGEQSFTVQ